MPVPIVTQPRTEAERVVIFECGGPCMLSMSLILLMRSTGMQCSEATAIARACKWAAVEGNVPDAVIGRSSRQQLQVLIEGEDAN